MEKKQERTLARRLSRELTPEELEIVSGALDDSGGGTSMVTISGTPAGSDDCGVD